MEFFSMISKFLFINRKAWHLTKSEGCEWTLWKVRPKCNSKDAVRCSRNHLWLQIQSGVAQRGGGVKGEVNAPLRFSEKGKIRKLLDTAPRTPEVSLPPLTIYPGAAYRMMGEQTRCFSAVIYSIPQRGVRFSWSVNQSWHSFASACHRPFIFSPCVQLDMQVFSHWLKYLVIDDIATKHHNIKKTKQNKTKKKNHRNIQFCIWLKHVEVL